MTKHTMTKRTKRNPSDTSYHFTWATKQRCPVLQPEVADIVMEAIEHMSGLRAYNILALSVQADHVHWYVQLPHTVPVVQAVGAVKWYSSLVTRRELPYLARDKKALWQRHYFVRTIGGEGAAVMRYITDHNPMRIYEE